MPAILDFQVAGLADLFSLPLSIIMPILVLVSQIAQFALKIDVSTFVTLIHHKIIYVIISTLDHNN
jgi:hypothetical protein